MAVFLILFFISAVYGAEVTYDGIGTFTDKDFQHAIYRPIVLLPKSPEQIDPTFSLFTRDNPDEPDVFSWNDTKIESSRFNPKVRIILIIHGFNENVRGWMTKMKDNYLKVYNVNVILVEYPKGDGFPYAQAVANARIVGPLVGDFLRKLQTQYNISMDTVHIIGHSLGSHVAGFAGKRLNGTVGRITGLDPAGPYFEGITDPRARLWHTDAKFVDSIHTDATHNSIPFSGLGMFETCSHVDIYPNGGHGQPGCTRERLTSMIVDGMAEGTRRLLLCSHIRSVDFYTESILPSTSKPMAYQCKDFDTFIQGKCVHCDSDGSRSVMLGPNAENNDIFIKKYPIGTRFFMVTAEHQKFFRFQYLIRIVMADKSNDRKKINTKITMKFITDGGNKSENLEFNEKSQDFDYGQSYSRVIILDMGPEQIEQIEFKWSKSKLLGLLSSNSMFVNSLRIISLSTRKSFNKNNPDNNQLEEIVFKPELSPNNSNKNEILFKRI